MGAKWVSVDFKESGEGTGGSIFDPTEKWGKRNGWRNGCFWLVVLEKKRGGIIGRGFVDDKFFVDKICVSWENFWDDFCILGFVLLGDFLRW